MRELSAERSMAFSGCWAKKSGTGASRMIEPLPVVSEPVGPQYGSRVSSNRKMAPLVVLPIPKPSPILLR